MVISHIIFLTTFIIIVFWVSYLIGRQHTFLMSYSKTKNRILFKIFWCIKIKFWKNSLWIICKYLKIKWSEWNVIGVLRTLLVYKNVGCNSKSKHLNIVKCIVLFWNMWFLMKPNNVWKKYFKKSLNCSKLWL